MARSIRGRIAVWTAAGVLGTGLVAGGVAQAVSTPTPSSSPSPDKGGADGKGGWEGKGGKAKAKHHGHGLGRLGGRMLHGEAVVKTKDGYRTVVIQRGTIASVSPTSLRLRSDDGFTATYVIGADTWVRKGHEQRQPSGLAAGDSATVVATRSGNALTATRVLAHTTKPPGSPAPAK